VASASAQYQHEQRHRGSHGGQGHSDAFSSSLTRGGLQDK
jgi:hypothetical protein